MTTNLKPMLDAVDALQIALRELEQTRRKLHRADAALRAIERWAKAGPMRREAVEALCRNTIDAINGGEDGLSRS